MGLTTAVRHRAILPAMFKRIVLFLAVNFLVVTTISDPS